MTVGFLLESVLENKEIGHKPEKYAVGFSDVPSLVTEEMRNIMRSNSLALEEMLTRKSLGLDFVVRMRDLNC
jgi:hypothetical protein